jgi:outer membrane receptor protein involved in Fe transport
MNSAGLTRFVAEIGRPLPALLPATEDQFELGLAQSVANGLRVGMTGYYRTSHNPVHTVVFPDARIYGYANFDRGKAYGVETRLEVADITTLGLSGYLNYALGRVWFYNPVIGGFTTEAAHLDDASRFLAPMDQTHTLTAGVTYRNRATGLWTSITTEYGSGTPVGHGGHGHEHEIGEAAHSHSAGEETPGRVRPHWTPNVVLGWDALRKGDHPGLTLQFNIENITNRVYVVAQESPFTPGQYSAPRQISGSIKVHF